MDDLFQIGEEKLILDSKKKLVTEYEMEDISIMHNFLDLEVWQKPRRDYVESRKVCSGDLEGIQNDGLGIHDYADDDGFILVILHLGELMPTYSGR